MTMARVKSTTQPSVKDDWLTPAIQWGVEPRLALFDKLNAIFQFDVDMAATPKQSLCPEYVTPYDDALSFPWEDEFDGFTVFCNPPFSKKAEFLQQGRRAAMGGVTCVFVVPASAPETSWFTNAVSSMQGVGFNRYDVDVWNLIGRVKYVDTNGVLQPRPDFPTAVIVMYPGLKDGRTYIWDWKDAPVRSTGLYLIAGE